MRISIMHQQLFSAAAVLAALSLAAPQATLAQSPATDKKIKAQSFMNTFGVNLHLTDPNYQNTQAIADALNIIGFSRVRVACRNAAEVAAIKDVAGKSAGYFPAGLKTDVIITAYLNEPTTFAQQQQTIPQIAPLIETIEGPNEIDNYYTGLGTHGPLDTPNPAADANGSWYPAADDQTKKFAANYGAWAKAIFLWRKRTPALANVKLLAPTLAVSTQEASASLPNVSAYVTSGDYHFYAGNGRQPSNFGGGNFSAIYDWYKAAAVPTKPVSVSEWGQTTASKPGQGGCDNATQAKYILNQLCDLTAKSVYRAYLYQLMDDSDDGDPSGNAGAESHFGIFDYQWHVKPAAQALASVKNLLMDSTANFTPKMPNYSVRGVTNAGVAGSSLAISKSDGSTFIVVWNEPQIWDQKVNALVTPPADPVTVSFGGTYTYKVYDPLIGISAIAAGGASSITVNVTGSPIMIQLIPISTASTSFMKTDTTTSRKWKGVHFRSVPG